MMAEHQYAVAPPVPPQPAVPPGPGVQPPFVAAPIEGRRARTWLSLGVAGGLLVACCGVGGLAVGGLLILGGQAVNEQAQDAVDDYLTAVSAQNWEQAYELRCAQDRAGQTLAEFTASESAQPPIQSYEVGDIEAGDDGVNVPVRVVYVDGTRAGLSVPVEQDRQGQFEVCGAIQGTP
jgi:hypothetical protein